MSFVHRFIVVAVMTAVAFFGLAGHGETTDLQPYWDWQLDTPVDISSHLQVMDVDPDAITSAQMVTLKARGTKMICYVSVGTVENWRADKGAFPVAVVGRVYGEWPDENFLDLRQLDVLLPIMRRRFQHCKDLGFDAVEPDNIDIFQLRTGFPLTTADAVQYTLALARIAHEMGMEIGQKNAGDLTADLVSTLDFIITEDCFADEWCDEVKAYVRAGKDVLATEYTDMDFDWKAACDYAKENNYHMILKNRDLDAALQVC